MGSLEEEKLFQMVHDFIESKSKSDINPLSSHQSLPSTDHYAKNYILQEIVESRTAAENAVLGCVLKCMRNKRGADKNSSLQKWLVVKLRKNGYHGASLCQTSWPTTSGCPGGDHEFIEVNVIEATTNQSSSRLILDIDFKSQFELARPTPSYKELSDKLPSIFIGDEQKLTEIISILCSEAKRSLKERGLHIPPWRTRTYMQSKWLANPQRISSSTNTEEAQIIVEPFSSKFNQLTGLTPDVKTAKQRNFVGRSALSCQLANLRTNCC